MEFWRFSSYLADPGWAGNPEHGAGIWGIVALATISFLVFSKILVRSRGVHSIHAVKAMFLAMLVCLGLTLGTQQIGLLTFGLLKDTFEPPSSSQSTKVNPAVTRGVIQGAGHVIPKEAKGALLVGLCLLVLVAALFLVGGGYALTAIPMPLWAHLIAFTVGVGCTEELCKFLAATLLLTPSLALFRHRRSLLPFVVAGLAFGVGEALFYFQDYSAASCEPAIYLVRASWCVLLHVAWTAIIGKSVLAEFGEVPELMDLRWKSGFRLLLLVLPVAALHGCYDALLVHDIPFLALIVGLISLGWAASVWEAYEEPAVVVAA
jgi:hypothetical protein